MIKSIAKTFGMLTVVAAATACVNEAAPESEPVSESSAAIAISAHEATLIVQFLNSPSTTLALLDDTLALDSRAAEALIAKRNGADLAYPSADDDTFANLEEVDAVAYVGAVTMEKIRTYAVAHAPPPPELVEGVQFSSDQVLAVVWGVNHATLPELDEEIGLLKNAAQSLIAGAPYTSVTQMGALAYVGPSALATIRDHAVVWAAEMGGSGAPSEAGSYDGVEFDAQTAQAGLAIAKTATHEQLTQGAGMTSGGANAIVLGRPFATLRAVSDTYGVGSATMQKLHDYAANGAFGEAHGTTLSGDECDATAECAEGLICAGTTIYEHGFCRPEWMAGTFESTTDVAIPDNAAAGIQSQITVSGLASVPEDVIVHLDIDHPRVADLQVVLNQPGGGQEVIWQAGSNGQISVSAGPGIERDNMVNGVWTLQVIDKAGGMSGTLKGWSLELTSRMD